MTQQMTLSTQASLALSIHPGMKQSLHVLQLSAAELADYLEQQTIENPLLELKPSKKKQTNPRGDGLGFNWVRQPEETLEMVLIRQLRDNEVPIGLRKIARFLAGSLNDDGYLTIGLEDTCVILGISPEEALAGLAALQALEPAGVGARNLQECLQLQMSRDPQAVPGASAIIESCMSELARNNIQKICQATGLSLADAERAIAYIRSLDPRPGLKYATGPSPVLIPDAIVRKDAQGRFTIVINSASIPRVALHTGYRQLKNDSECEYTRAYIQSHMQSAKQLLNGMEKRRHTLHRVIEAIVKEQEAFLERGPQYLKPLSMKAIANMLDLHESTVSRAVQHKYVQTPQGLLELKSFFCSSISSRDGDLASAGSVKTMIRSMIEREDRAKPLSDQELADMLNEQGIRISRRTVTKYREELHILSTRYRRASGGTEHHDRTQGIPSSC